jgi:hypothetical protein
MSKTEKAPKKEFHRVIRGGSWYDGSRTTPVVRRRDRQRGICYGDLSFRLVEVLDEFDQDASRNHNTIKAQ